MPPRRPPPPHALQSLSPARILTQIVSLQLLYYLATTSLILFTALTSGKHFTLDLVLSWKSLRGDTAVGWTLGLCWLVGGGLAGYACDLTTPHLLHLAENPESPSGFLLMIVLVGSQNNSPPPPHFPLKTGPRFRPDTSFPSPCCCFAIYQKYTHKLAMVGAAGGQCRIDDLRRCLELSVEGIETNDFWDWRWKRDCIKAEGSGWRI